MTEQERLLKLVRNVVNHIAIDHMTDVNGSPMVRITVFTRRGAFMGEYYDGKTYEPGSDAMVDLAALFYFVELMDSGKLVVKKRTSGASVRDDKAIGG